MRTFIAEWTYTDKPMNLGRVMWTMLQEMMEDSPEIVAEITGMKEETK